MSDRRTIYGITCAVLGVLFMIYGLVNNDDTDRIKSSVFIAAFLIIAAMPSQKNKQ